MLSVLFYLFLFVICTFFLVLSAVALLLTWPFDKSRRIVHELSRILVRIFYAVPPLWKFRVTGREYIDRRKPYVIVVNHQAGLDIPTLYFVPLNFRWVSKREVFKVPFFGQFLLLHGDICINRSHATAAMEKVIRDGKLWLSRGASVAIFPEGTRSHDGAIHRFKAGAFTLAREAGVDSFVYKNVGIDELFAVMRSTLAGYCTFPKPPESIFSGTAALDDVELSILRLACEGKSRREIAAELFMSEGTIKRRISEILNKTGYDNIMRLAVHAVTEGSIVPNMERP